MGMDVSVWGAFIAGLISFISPCVLPLVPPYLAYLAGTSIDQLTGENEAGQKVGAGRLVLASFAFVLGFTTVFVLLGASAWAAGEFVREYMHILAYIAGAIIIVMGLHFLGVFRIGLLYREARVHVDKAPAGILGAYLMGLAFAFGWTPCVGPVLSAILFMASAEDTVTRGAFLLGSYSLGLGIPFLIAAGFAGAFMRFLVRFRKHLGLVEKIMGVLLVLTGILFITGQMSVMSYWLLELFPKLGTLG